jgi:HEAT repeats
MKLIGKLLLAALMTVFVVWNGIAGDDTVPAATPKTDVVVRNLLIGLTLNNCGVEHDAAFMLGEYKASSAVIPLLAILHDDMDCDCCRIVAALALSRIGDARGTYAVKEAVKHDPSRRVRNLCAYYYNEYVKAGSFKFVVERETGELVAEATTER